MNNFCNLLTKALKIWGKIATANMCISILLSDILFMGILEEVPSFPLLVSLPLPKEKNKKNEPCKLHVQPFPKTKKKEPCELHVQLFHWLHANFIPKTIFH